MVWLMKCLKNKVILAFVIFFSIGPAFSSLPTEADLKKVKFEKSQLEIGNLKIQVEVARTDEQKELGLMYRTQLLDHHGMLFVFNDEDIRTFWMKNTFIDLSIGYFDRSKKLIDIHEMKAVHSVMETPKTYTSRGPAMYALEVPSGWFSKNKIKIGQVFRLHP